MALPATAAQALANHGFVVLPGPYGPREWAQVPAAYDAACLRADAADVHIGRTSTRIDDFVNRDPVFDAVYSWPPALDAARRIIGGEFRLSAFHSRTLHLGAAAQEMHVDISRTSDAWPMLGLIIMVDDFRSDNGATRFLPGSHRWVDAKLPQTEPAVACGPVGSAILFDASTWHGHGANSSSSSRRSLQATFIPRAGRPATDFVGRMDPATLARLGPASRYLVGAQ